MEKIALGGGCHWCSEAVFETLKGVTALKQGWVSAKEENARSFSEAVIVEFDENTLPLSVLIEVHLLTHNATANHSMRKKYRSAIYTFTQAQKEQAKKILQQKAALFEKKIITQVYSFDAFRLNEEKYLSYYKKNPQKPFCKTYIEPKLQMLFKKYGEYL